jgi:6-pyruvoyl-tetrahydropterin synthase
MELSLSVYLRSAKQSSVDLADILKAASYSLMIQSYANTKSEASTFGVCRILVFCFLHFATSTYVCRVTWQPIADIQGDQKVSLSSNNPHTIDDLKMAITEYIWNVDHAILNTVFENTVRRVNKCLETGRGTL